MKRSIPIKPLNEWEILRKRYPTIRAYKKRNALSLTYLEDFSNWLVDQGADVFTKTEQYEVLRFKLNGQLGIWYTNNAGNLLMHDLSEKFKTELAA